MGKPPPSPQGGARKLDPFELRIANLRRELEAERDGTVKAAILYHMGSLYEHERAHIPEAVHHYAQAAELAPQFLPAAMARMRLAEREESTEDSRRLYADVAETTEEATAKAAALLDLAIRSDDWAPLVQEAIACAPDPYVPALLSQWLSDVHGDRGALREALRAQTECAEDPVLRATLWLDLALAEIDDRDIDAALRSLELACESDALAWSARALQRHTARAHGAVETWRNASVAMAERLEEEPPADPLSASIPLEERLPTAAFLWEEAARLSARELGDRTAAHAFLSSAMRLRPDDRRLRLQALLLAEDSGDQSAMDGASAWFDEHASSDPAFVAFSIRRAGLRTHDPSAVERLRTAARDYPQSAYAEAALDMALARAARGAERAERLRQRADTRSGETRARLLWHAASLLTAEADGADEAQTLYVEAANAAPHDLSLSIFRDALQAALRREDPGAILARAGDLLERDVPDDERSRLWCLRYAVTRHLRKDELAARRLLLDALGDPACRDWAPHVARIHAASTDDPSLLAMAHEALAKASQEDAAIGHWCAAGRAHARKRDWAAAERAFRQALAASPTDSNVVRALEHALREGGRPEEIVALDAAGTDGAAGAGLGELSLLLAGATAERNGDLGSAQVAYEQALRRAPDSASAALALADVGRRQKDSETRARAYEALERTSLGPGTRALFALMRGDALETVDDAKTRPSDAYEAALEDPDTAAAAAVSLLCTPWHLANDEQRAAAEEVLADAGVPLSEPAEGFASAYTTLRGVLGEPGASAGEAWLELSSQSPSERLAAEAMLHGVREIRLSRGEQALDELFMVVQGSEALAADHADAAIAIDEVLAPADDPELLASALRDRLSHTTELGENALQAARCRALVEAGHGSEAVALVSRALDERPDDLGLWETLRTAARSAEQWPLLAQACERLATFVDGALKADLLEEAGAVRMDCLGQQRQAEDAFRAALEADPAREVAFRRLHDVLAAREDADALEALVSSRLALSGARDRPDLLYERARLLRGFSDRPGALEVLDELFTAEPEHSGALALAAEVHVSLEQWKEAVDCLRRLSRCDIPNEQRRVAHLGAADFLETRLGAKHEALLELREVAALGLADVDTWLRIGVLEEATGGREAAADAYQRALEGDPARRLAVGRLQTLLEGDERLSVLARFEDALWSRIEGGDVDDSALEGLREVASWRGNPARASAVAAVQAALDGGKAGDGAETADLSHVPIASIWNPESSTVVEDIVRIAGIASAKDRIRSKKLDVKHPVATALDDLSNRHGVRYGSVGVSNDVEKVRASLARDGEIHWLIPSRCAGGLEPHDRFRAGQLAWAVPRGAGDLLDQSAHGAAGALVAILRASRCRVRTGGPVLPAVSVKLRRAVRKSVQEAVADADLGSDDLVAAARRIQRGADRAGLLASGDIAAALTVVCGAEPSAERVRSSPRARDLLHFWMAADSPLWRRDV